MEIRKIQDRELFDQYVLQHPYTHYMKTSMWGEFRKKTEHLRYEMLGFYDGERLCGTAMVVLGTWMLHRYAYIPWGPCIDYADEALRTEVFRLLKEYADEKKVQFLRVDPNVLRMHRTITGEAVDDGFNNEAVTDGLKQLGYTHKGYGYAYNGSWTNRFTLIADLTPDMETVIGRYAKARKTALNRHKVIGVTTRLGGREDIPYLMDFEKQLTEQDGFAPHSRKFFEALLDCFKSHAVIYVTEIDLDHMIEGITGELSSKKYRKDPEARAAKERECGEAVRLKEKYGAKLPVACGLFIRTGDISFDLYTYNHKEFNFVKPVDQLHAFAMRDMKEHGVRRYDMCGFSGTTTKDDPYYGLYAYKRSFGPEYIEQIGEFDYVRKARAMKRFRFEKLAVNHVKRRYWALRYKKKETKE